MARLTGLGPMGLSGRKYNFESIPAVPKPFPVAVSRGGFFSDVIPVIQHVAPVKVLLLDELRVISDARIISPPQTYTEAVTILLEEGFFSSPGERFMDGEELREAKRRAIKVALKWLNWTDTNNVDPFNII